MNNSVFDLIIENENMLKEVITKYLKIDANSISNIKIINDNTIKIIINNMEEEIVVELNRLKKD